MFDVSWEDPERETVGERRHRKQQRSACASRNGPRVPSRGSQTQSSSLGRPPPKNVFGPSTLYTKKSGLSKGRQSRSSSTLRLDGPKQTSYTASSDSSFQETPRTSTATTRTPETEFFSDSYKFDYEQSRLSSQSEDSGTNSTWSMNAESISSTGKIVQHLSPTSYVTQSTEITISPRASIKDTEQAAIMVHISASGTMHVHDSASRRPSQAALLDFLNDDNDTSDERETEEESEKMETQLMAPPVWTPIPWEPPEAWGCSKEEKDVSVSPSFKTRGLGLPFRPARPRRRSERELSPGGGEQHYFR